MKATTFYNYLAQLVQVMPIASSLADKPNDGALWLCVISIIVFKILSNSKVLEDDLVF